MSLIFVRSAALRADFGAAQLRAVTRKTKNEPQARRPLALAAIYDEAGRTEAPKIDDVMLQIVRDRMMKFNATAPEGLMERKAPRPYT